MAKGRSPNYPAYGLEESVKLVAEIFKSEHRNKMSREVVASHLGYSGMSGRALTKIGTLRAYGLLEGNGDELRVSDDAIIILNAPINSSDRHKSLKRCALNPSLFNELYQKFDARPSPENLKYMLIRMNFTSDAAPVAMEAFLRSMEFARVWEELSAKDNVEADRNLQQEPAPEVFNSDDARQNTTTDETLSRSRREVFGLDEGDVVIIYPEKMSPSSFEDLEDYLSLFIKKLKRRNLHEK